MWRRREPLLEARDVDGIIQLLMRIDENVARIARQVVEEDDDGPEEEDA